MDVTLDVLRNRSYRAGWNPKRTTYPVLRQSSRGYLLFRERQVFVTHPPKQYEQVIYRNHDVEFHTLPDDWPDGRYDCCLADKNRNPVTEWKSVILGEKRPVRVTRDGKFLSFGFAEDKVEIRSPLQILAGQCGIEYSLPDGQSVWGVVSLPGSTWEGGSHVIRFRFLHLNPNLNAVIRLRRDLCDLLILNEEEAIL